jgi:beta-lactamase superfamily II metal-dependent hydrolase
MFYIKHGSDNFTIIDCYIHDDNKEDIIDELKSESKDKGIIRFISTHPDDDHIHGLNYLDDKMKLLNFYCVKNEASKDNNSDDFGKYCELRDESEKAFYIFKGCSRKWMNESNDERGGSGINILWPIVKNKHFKEALRKAKNGESPNNISPILRYSFSDGPSILWMGDLETDFMENVKDEIEFPKTDVLFAPHHGRSSGKLPEDWLKKCAPEIIVIGEAPSEDLEYYNNYNTITQNSAGDIIFECLTGKAHIYVSNQNYTVNFLDSEDMNTYNYYIGTLNIKGTDS